jgi:hypothetical protein
MASIKMVVGALALVGVWLGVAAVCFTSIATVPANLVAIDHGRSPPRAPAPVVPEAPATSVAQASVAASP